MMNGEVNENEEESKETKTQQARVCYRCISAHSWLDIYMDYAS